MSIRHEFAYQKFFTMNGETLTLGQWAKRYGVRAELVHDRVLVQGWPLARAVAEPPMTNTERAAMRRARTALIAKASAAFGPSKTVKLRFPNKKHTQIRSTEDAT